MSTAHDADRTVEAPDGLDEREATTEQRPTAPIGDDDFSEREAETLTRTVVLLGRLSLAAALAAMVILCALGMRVWSVTPMLLLTIAFAIVDLYARRRGITLPPPIGQRRRQSPALELTDGAFIIIAFAILIAMLSYQDFTGHPLMDVGFVKHEKPDPADTLSLHLDIVVGFTVVMGVVTAFRWVKARNREREQRQS